MKDFQKDALELSRPDFVLKHSWRFGVPWAAGMSVYHYLKFLFGESTDLGFDWGIVLLYWPLGVLILGPLFTAVMHSWTRKKQSSAE